MFHVTKIISLIAKTQIVKLTTETPERCNGHFNIGKKPAKMCDKIFFIYKIHKEAPVPETFFKLQAEPCNFVKKDTPTQVFSCNFWETFQNIFFYRTLRRLPL